MDPEVIYQASTLVCRLRSCLVVRKHLRKQRLVLEPKEKKDHLAGFDLLVLAIFFRQIQL